MVDEGVGLGLFPSDLFEPRAYYFDEIAHTKPLYRSSNHAVFQKSKKYKTGSFLAIFELISAVFLEHRSCDFDATPLIAHTFGCRTTVQEKL